MEPVTKSATVLAKQRHGHSELGAKALQMMVLGTGSVTGRSRALYSCAAVPPTKWPASPCTSLG